MIIAVGASGAKAGKTTFCNYLMGFLGDSWQYLSTSDTLVLELSGKKKITPEEILENKEKYRPELIKLSKKDPEGPMTRTLLKWDPEKHLLVESVRRISEYNILNRPQTVFIYIYATDANRLKRGAPATDINEIKDLFMPYGEPANNCYLVNNNKSIRALQERAEDISNIIRAEYLI